MEEKKTNELTDEALNTVTGGVFGRVEREGQKTHKTACRRCGDEFPTSVLIGGYCPTCYDELRNESIYMPIPR